MPTVEYVKPATSDLEHIFYVMQNMHWMTTAELRNELKIFNTESRGERSLVYNRLKKYVLKNAPRVLDAVETDVEKAQNHYDYFVVIDFECTCDESNSMLNEIIEFPAVLVDVGQKKVVDTFRSFVRPTLNPKLTDFCTKLTGITQENIDEALPFIDVLDLFRHWMAKNNLGKENSKYAFVTDGPWDLAKFFQMECLQVLLALYFLTDFPSIYFLRKTFEPEQNNITVPHDFRYYVNLRRVFLAMYRKNGARSKFNLESIMNELNIPFNGKRHSGIDDSLNIAEILLRLLQDNAFIRTSDFNFFQINERLVKRKPLEVSETELVEMDERTLWRYKLPYKIAPVTQYSFLCGDYLTCDSCDEDNDM